MKFPFADANILLKKRFVISLILFFLDFSLVVDHFTNIAKIDVVFICPNKKILMIVYLINKVLRRMLEEVNV